jgi:CheY-like chemotaxis protein
VARVVALFNDLMLGSNVQGVLTAGGHVVELVSDEVAARAQAPEADVLVVDLGAQNFDGVSLVDSMKAGGELGGTRTVGVYSHVDAETRARALEVGFDLVTPRSRMAREGARLVEDIV